MSESEFETHSIPEENGNGSVHSEEKLNNREESENRENRENTHHNEADDCVLETDSNGSMEDTMAKLEHALKKNFERFEDLQEICENGNGCEEVKGKCTQCFTEIGSDLTQVVMDQQQRYSPVSQSNQWVPFCGIG